MTLRGTWYPSPSLGTFVGIVSNSCASVPDADGTSSSISSVSVCPLRSRDFLDDSPLAAMRNLLGPNNQNITFRSRSATALM